MAGNLITGTFNGETVIGNSGAWFNGPFDGEIFYTAVWNRALDNNEISQIYSSSNLINESENLSKSIKKIDNNTILVHGDTEIEKIEKFFKIELTGIKEITNVNGLLHNILKDLPKQGDKVEFENLILKVEELEDNRPNKVIIKKK